MEDELWACVAASDGVRCPLRMWCVNYYLGGKQDGCTEDGWCLDRNLGFAIRRYEKLSKKCDQEFIPSPDCDFVFLNPCRIFGLIEFAADCFLQRAGIRHPPVPINLAMQADPENGVEVRLVPLEA